MPDRGHDIDLHPYIRDPKKARAILDAAISDCKTKGVSQFRVVHGKGKGQFRNLIQSHLDNHPDVEGFILCDPAHGGSGASWVHLKSDEAFEAVSKSPETKSGKPAWRWLAYLAAIAGAFLLSSNYMPLVVTIVIVLWLEFRLTNSPDSDI